MFETLAPSASHPQRLANCSNHLEGNSIDGPHELKRLDKLLLPRLSITSTTELETRIRIEGLGYGCDFCCVNSTTGEPFIQWARFSRYVKRSQTDLRRVAGNARWLRGLSLEVMTFSHHTAAPVQISYLPARGPRLASALSAFRGITRPEHHNPAHLFLNAIKQTQHTLQYARHLLKLLFEPRLLCSQSLGQSYLLTRASQTGRNVF